MSELAIRNLDDLREIANMTAVSALLPRSLQGKSADVGVIIMYGADLGLSPMQAIQGIYVVNGRPTLAAQTWLALARRAGHKIKVEEHTDEKCTIHIVRGDTGEEHTSTYTYAEAQAAKLTGKDVWQQHRKAMLLARAVSSGCRFACPEIALGFYAEGELDEPEKVTAVRVDQEPMPDPIPPAEAVAAVEAIEAEFADVIPGSSILDGA